MVKKVDEIVAAIEDQEHRTADWRALMDTDLDLVEGKPYQTPEAVRMGEGRDIDDGGFRIFTSNEAQTFAKKVISTLVFAKLATRVPAGIAVRDKRDSHDLKERLAVGFLESANERRIKMSLGGSVLEELVWYTCIRGAYVVRALLVKDADGGQHVDITPLDPRDTYWKVGKNGLDWAATKSWMTIDDVEANFGIRVAGHQSGLDLIEVIDYYDHEKNMVVIPEHKEGFAKRPTRHGSDGVPIHIGMVGAHPRITRRSRVGTSATPGGSDYSVSLLNWGQSIFVENRETYALHNEIMSIYLHLVAAAREQTWTLNSRGAEKQLDDNPNNLGGVISLDVEDKLQPIPLPEMTKDAAALLGLTSGELQRGSISHASFGELPFQLSGFAINSLRRNELTVLQPPLTAIGSAFKQVFDSLCDQYVSGQFSPMQLSGTGNNREYFDEEPSPDDVRDLPGYQVKLVANLPQDDAAKIAIAQQARDGPNGVPIYDDLFIHEEILETPDPGVVMDRIDLQMAKRAHPSALAMTLMNAAEDRDEPAYAQIYLQQLIVEMINTQLQLAQGQQAALAFQQQQAAPPGGVSPAVIPPAAAGAPVPTPTPQSGANVAPGSPRPGAQNRGLV